MGTTPPLPRPQPSGPQPAPQPGPPPIPGPQAPGSGPRSPAPTPPQPSPVACMAVASINASCAQLTAAVGPNAGTNPGQQPNKQPDVQMVQRLINVIVRNGYMDSSVLGGGKDTQPTLLIENGAWSPALFQSIRQIERLYFHGRANPHGIGVIDAQADESMFTFLVALANGSQKAKQTLSVQMKALAAAMVPGGMVLIDAGGTAPDGSVTQKKISAIDVYLPILLDALMQFNLTDTDMVMMALACARTETGDFQPKSEKMYDLNTTGTYTNNATGQETYTSAVDNVHGTGYKTLLTHHTLQTKKVAQETWTPNQAGTQGDIYDGINGNNQPNDGWKYRGRGLIQLTGKNLYRDAGQKARVGDLFVNDPDQVNTKQYAGIVVAGYLAAGQNTIRSALKRGDLTAARIAVNGGKNGLKEFVASWHAGTALIAQSVIEAAKVQVRRHRRHRKKH